MRSANAKHDPATLFLSIYPTVYTLYPHLKVMFREALFVWTWNWKEAEMPINSRIRQSIIVFPACWNTTQHWKWITTYYNKKGASLVAQMVKSLPAVWETWVPSLNWKIPWRRKYQSTPVLLPGKFHGLRSLVGYCPWGRKESDTTEQLHFHFHMKKDGVELRDQGEKIKTQKNI